MSSLRSQLLKEMSSLVPSGTKKGIRSQNSTSGAEESIPEHDVGQQDEETLEILQGDFFHHLLQVLWPCFDLVLPQSNILSTCEFL